MPINPEIKDLDFVNTVSVVFSRDELDFSPRFY